MHPDFPIVVDILKRLFGAPKALYANQIQFEFNCPTNTCKRDKNKYNLNFRAREDHCIYHCWKCGYSGFAVRLLEDYGTADDVRKYKILFPSSIVSTRSIELKEIDEHVTCELPEGYRPLTKNWSSSLYEKAITYLHGRGITDDMIKKYELGYTEWGPRKFRIIVPSRNKFGEINYYEARSFLPKSKRPYWKPKSPDKSDIIFNALNINFDLPVYLVEGPFDMFPLPNALPMLGKILPDNILAKFIKHKTRVILCLDEDALKDSVRLYMQMQSYDIDVYFVEVKDDIAKCFEKFGREELIRMLRKYKKLDFQYLFALKLRDKQHRKNYSDEALEKEWSNTVREFKELNEKGF